MRGNTPRAYKISVVAMSEKKRRLKHETDSFLRDYLPREIIFYMSESLYISVSLSFSVWLTLCAISVLKSTYTIRVSISSGA